MLQGRIRMHIPVQDPLRLTSLMDAAMSTKRLALIALFCCCLGFPVHSQAANQRSYTVTWNNQSNGPCHPLTVQVKVATLSPETFEIKDVLLHNNTTDMTFSPATVLRSGSASICTMRLSTLCYYHGLSGGLSVTSDILPCASGTATISTGSITLATK